MAIPFLSNISGKSATLAGTLSVGGGDSSTAQVALKGQQSLLSFLRGTSGDAQFFMSSDSARLYFSHTNIQSTNLILTLNQDESATFAGKINAKGGANITGMYAATINAYTTTVSSSLYSALRIIDSMKDLSPREKKIAKTGLTRYQNYVNNVLASKQVKESTTKQALGMSKPPFADMMPGYTPPPLPLNRQ